MKNLLNAKGHARLGNALIYFCGFGLAATSMLKFFHPAPVVAYMGYLGYASGTYVLIAGLELLAAVLFLLRSTRAAGLLLVSAYLGGAIAAHLANHPFSGGGPFLAFNANHHYLGTLPAIVFLASAWIGVWLRHPESVRSFTQQTRTEPRPDSGEPAPASPSLQQGATQRLHSFR